LGEVVQFGKGLCRGRAPEPINPVKKNIRGTVKHVWGTRGEMHDPRREKVTPQFDSEEKVHLYQQKKSKSQVRTERHEDREGRLRDGPAPERSESRSDWEGAPEGKREIRKNSLERQ